MTVTRFLREYLKDFARITITSDNGDILYTGDVVSVSREIITGLYVKPISGLGDENDIIITCYEG